MAKQTINIGASPNDGTGTPLRTAFDYTNQNFTELYTATGPSGNNIVVPGSATITGDLTVDTSTLKVDSANNRVGIGTASPAALVDVSGAKDATNMIVGAPLSTVGGVAFVNYSELLFKNTAGANSDASIRSYGNVWNAGGSQLALFTSNNGAPTERFRLYNNGVATWSNVDGVAGIAMTLNSNGLGVATNGYSGTKLTVLGVSYFSGGASSTEQIRLGFTDGTSYWGIGRDNVTTGNLLIGNGSTRLTIDATGDLGIGVTPSAWAGIVGIQSAYGAFSGNTNINILRNAYYNGGWKYTANGRATQYQQDIASHIWYYDTGTQVAGAACNFTAAMTLDANGNLILQSSATPATLTTNGQLTVNATSNTNLRFSYRGSDGVTRVANLTLA